MASNNKFHLPVLNLVMGVGGGVVAHVIIVSSQVPLVLTLGLWTLGLRTWA